MPIASVVERGGVAYLYDAQNSQIGQICLSYIDKEDGVAGYTASTVTIRRDGWLYVYDERTNLLFSRSAR